MLIKITSCFLYAPSRLDWPSSYGPVLKSKETKTKLTLFIVDSSIGSKLFFLEVQLGSYLIDPELLQEKANFILDNSTQF